MMFLANNRQLDRELGFHGDFREQALDLLVAEDPSTDVDSYLRAGAALHLALLPTSLLRIPEATLEHLREAAESVKKHGA